MNNPAAMAADTVSSEDAALEAAPVKSSNRIETLDFIRGIAVMGILAANIVAFGQPSNAYMYPSAFLVDPADPGGWQWIAQYVFIDGKMRGLFTLLFGAGMYLFMERAWARGSSRWLQIWRLFLLACFGAVHFFFIWMGDILLMYGLIGFLAVAAMRWSAKMQWVVGLTGYIFGALFYAAMMSFPYLIAETSIGEQPEMSEARAGMAQGIEQALADDAIATGLIQSGDYAGLAARRLTEQWYLPLTNTALFVFETLPLMLMGMALYRFGFFSGAFDRGKMIRWGWIGLAAGAFCHLGLGLIVQGSGFGYYATLAAFMGWAPLPRIAMVLGIAALLIAYSPGWTGWLAERVRAAGRAAFTNYLGTSIVMLFIMQGWALGLFGVLNRPQLYLLTVLICVLMLAWSKPWLDRYRYGPLEWLWRSLTYRKVFALKR